MAQAPIPDKLARAAWKVFEECNFSLSEAARRAKLPRSTLENRIEAARLRFGVDKNGADQLIRRVRSLERELRGAQEARLDHDAIRTKIVQLTKSVDNADEPGWTAKPLKSADDPGVPTLMLSDLHWGEVVKAPQIMRKNEYDLSIAQGRLEHCVETAIDLLRIISPKMSFPGIVVPLGGDMVSGNIHDELQATNEINTMPTVIDLYGSLVAAITRLADVFGHVFLPCVTGNHGRDTHKIWHKDRHHTSFDWLLYCFLAKHFAKDKRVVFSIPDGPDAYYRIFGTRYLLTHGDQFRGGDGVIGVLGPIIRGDHKKRSRNAQIDMAYDTMMMGHFHQYIHHSRVIINGSLKGYDEYAYTSNFGFERARQALWFTHPKHGITFRMPVYVDKRRDVTPTEWVSVTA